MVCVVVEWVVVFCSVGVCCGWLLCVERCGVGVCCGVVLLVVVVFVFCVLRCLGVIV